MIRNICLIFLKQIEELLVAHRRRVALLSYSAFLLKHVYAVKTLLFCIAQLGAF